MFQNLKTYEKLEIVKTRANHNTSDGFNGGKLRHLMAGSLEIVKKTRANHS